jgi:16S rRNA (cytidine1402-2'-O)-methyltransferase
MYGKLYLVATPIGNLADITLRALETLKRVDLVACENPRETLKLLTHHGIKGKKLKRYHAPNEPEAAQMLLNSLKKGKSVALVSDRGTPGFSDPGFHLIQTCLEVGVEIEVIPGPSALLSAVLLAGFPPQPFRFLGFLPRKGRSRRSLMEELRNEKATTVIYESPHRLVSLLTDLKEVLGEKREGALVREITKVYQEVIRGNLAFLREVAERRKLKGEIILVLGGSSGEENADEKKAWEVLKYLLMKEVSPSEAARVVAGWFSLPKKRVYHWAQELKNQ